MPKTKQQKEVILRDLDAKLAKANSVIFTGFDGLTVKDNEELRNKLCDEQGEFLAIKKTLLNKALGTLELNEQPDVKGFSGQVAVIFAYGDQVAPAKLVQKFQKDHEDKIAFLGGVLDGQLLSAKEVESLASLPSKLELQARLVGTLNAPISGFVNVLAGNLRGLVTVLKAVADQKAN
ncbi:MAG TPA: 50S ribosomal protein L10 [bacterium]|nr:50S ribosomal protein L10 [bacterium]